MKKSTLLKRLSLLLVALLLVLTLGACMDNTIRSESPDGDAASPELPKECSHVFTDDGTYVKEDGAFVRKRVCSLCSATVSENVTLVSESETWLYNTAAHWNQAVVLGSGASKSTVKANSAVHTPGADGKCTVCHYGSAPSEGLLYQLNGTADGYIVVGMGSCTDEHVNIPSRHEGLPVVGIGDNAFVPVESEPAPSMIRKGHEPSSKPQSIIGVSIPDTVTSISCTAFRDCVELNNFLVDVANTVFESKGNGLVDKVAGALVRGCEFTVIPDDGTVTVIGSYAFAGCETLVSITIPDSIESIEDKAFLECDALVEVKMPDKVDLGLDVFRGSIHVEVKIDHELILVPAKAPTCYEPGNIEHYRCTDCGYLYSDAANQNRLYNVEIPASHNFVDGECTLCGEVLDSVLIVSVDEVPYLGKFALGTMEDAIGLPSEVTVYTRDGEDHTLPVNWELSDYKKDVVGEYTIRGHIVAGKLHFAEGVSSAISTQIEIVEYMQGTADIVFVLDLTGSMYDEIQNVKQNIAAFAQALEARGVSARWAIVNYLDFEDTYEDSYITMNGASEWFISASEYATAIGNLVLGNGGDGPETAIDGLGLAMTLTTRQNARTFYIVVTDYGYKVDNNYGIESMDEMAEILADNKIYTSVITTSSWYEDYEILTETTGGMMSNIYGNFGDDLLNTLAPIIENKVTE